MKALKGGNEKGHVRDSLGLVIVEESIIFLMKKLLFWLPALTQQFIAQDRSRLCELCG